MIHQRKIFYFADIVNFISFRHRSVVLVNHGGQRSLGDQFVVNFEIQKAVLKKEARTYYPCNSLFVCLTSFSSVCTGSKIWNWKQEVNGRLP